MTEQELERLKQFERLAGSDDPLVKLGRGLHALDELIDASGLRNVIVINPDSPSSESSENGSPRVSRGQVATKAAAITPARDAAARQSSFVMTPELRAKLLKDSAARIKERKKNKKGPKGCSIM